MANLFCVLFTIFHMFDFWRVFWVVNFKPYVQVGCDWNMSNIFWEMFYNIIYHILEGGFISFWIIPLPYFEIIYEGVHFYQSSRVFACKFTTKLTPLQIFFNKFVSFRNTFSKENLTPGSLNAYFHKSWKNDSYYGWNLKLWLKHAPSTGIF